MHRGPHYGATPAKKPRLDTLCFSVYPSICPCALTHAQSTSASEHVSHCCVEKTLTFVTALRPGPEEPEEPEEPVVLWPLRDVSFVPRQHKRTDGRASRRHLSIGGELRLNRGHLFTLSQWPEIKNVLLCLCFCHDLKPGWTGNNSPLWKTTLTYPLQYQSSWMKMFYSLAVMLTTSAHGKLCNRTFSSLCSVDCSFMWPLSRGSEGSQTTQIMQKSQQARHMVAKKHPAQ